MSREEKTRLVKMRMMQNVVLMILFAFIVYGSTQFVPAAEVGTVMTAETAAFEAITETKESESITEETESIIQAMESESTTETEELESTTETGESAANVVITSIAVINPMYETVFDESQLREKRTGKQFITEEPILTTLDTLKYTIRNGLEIRCDEIPFRLEETNLPELEAIESQIYAAMEPYSGAPFYRGDSLRADFLGARIIREITESTDGSGVSTVIYAILPEYCSNVSQEMELRDAIYSVVEELNLSGVSDYEKVRKIYEYICSNVSYDHANAGNSTYYLKYSAYAAMLHRTAVNEGYASLFYQMCTRAGISCRMITGSSMGRRIAWNIVKVGSRYYNVDAAWGSSGQGTVNYDYFLKSDADFSFHDCDEAYRDYSFTRQYPKAAESYGGLTTYQGNYVYVTSGVIDTSVDSPLLSVDDGRWYYMVDGVCDSSFNGFVKKSNVWYRYVNGICDTAFCGLYWYNSVLYYVENGVVSWDFTGLVKYEGVWYYVASGMVDFTYTGLGRNPNNGLWFYVTSGEVDWSYAGLARHNGLWFYVENGLLEWNYTGLAKHDGMWFYIENGMIDWSFAGLVKHDGMWFYVENGMIDWDFTGLAKHDGIWFYVKSGMIDWDYIGLMKREDMWFYVENGMIDWDYTGLCRKDGVLYYVENGMIDWEYSGMAVYEGNVYEVTDGYVHADGLGKGEEI